MSTATEFIISALIILGALFVLLGSVGLARLPDFLMRLHGPTKATTMGVGATLLASAIFFSVQDSEGISLHELAPCSFCSSPRRLRPTCWPKRRCTATATCATRSSPPVPIRPR
jgi:multicomponent K+:H+ antiporter subunit G